MSADAARLRRAVGTVAGLNLAYALVEIGVALATRSVSLYADAADFLEDAAINALVLIALVLLRDDDGHRRGTWGKVLAAIVLVPAIAAAVEAVRKLLRPEAPEAGPVMLTALGALLVNAVCAWILIRHREAGGSLGKAAWLAARNDVLINVAIIAMGALTAWLATSARGWAYLPDLLLGALIIVLNVGAAKEVWEVAETEQLAAKALAGEEIGD